jgi:hypothetical protein
MGGLGEKVCWLDSGEVVVTVLAKQFEIAGKGGCFTANVDDALRLSLS